MKSITSTNLALIPSTEIIVVECKEAELQAINKNN